MAASVQRVSRHGALLLAALSAAGCGGTDNGRPKAAGTNGDAGDACAAGAGLTFANIMSFEPVAGSNPSLVQNATCDPAPALQLGKGACTYFNFDTLQSGRSCDAMPPSPPTCLLGDRTPVPDSFCTSVKTGSAQGVTAGSPNLPLSTIPGGRCGVSSSAFHLTANNVATCYSPTTLKQGWGLTIQITFNPSPANSGQSQLAFDASDTGSSGKWDGISFWERRDSGPSGGAFLFSIEDPYSANASTATNFMHPPACPIGVTSSDCFVQCSAMDGVPDAEKCDAFGLGVLLTEDWRLVKIPFDSVQQKGFGVPSPLGHLDTAALVGIQIALSAGNWDLWIDDIAFYRETTEAGAQ